MIVWPINSIIEGKIAVPSLLATATLQVANNFENTAIIYMIIIIVVGSIIIYLILGTSS